MNIKIVVLFLISFVLLAGLPTSLAKPQYLESLKTVYGNGSCETCHVSGVNDGPRTSYGKLFEDQPNYNNDPIAALKAIGAPSAAITPSGTATSTSQMTPEIETTSETSTPAGTTVEAAGTPTTPGFEIVAAIVGLIACSFLIKRKNK